MSVSFLVKGQGVFIFKNSEKLIKLHFFDKEKQNSLKLVLNERTALYLNSVKYVDPKNQIGTISLKGAYYWISINAQNQQIYV